MELMQIDSENVASKDTSKPSSVQKAALTTEEKELIEGEGTIKTEHDDERSDERDTVRPETISPKLIETHNKSNTSEDGNTAEIMELSNVCDEPDSKESDASAKTKAASGSRERKIMPKRLPIGGTKTAEIVRNRMEQHALWILKMEKKFKASKLKPVSKLSSAQIMEELSRTDRTIHFIDEALRQIESQASEEFRQNSSPLKSSVSSSPANQNDTLTEIQSLMPEVSSDIIENFPDSNLDDIQSRFLPIKPKTPVIVKNYLHPVPKNNDKKLKGEYSRCQLRWRQKMLKESKIAKVVTRKRPFFRTSTALKELDKKVQRTDSADVPLLERNRFGTEDLELRRYCLVCRKMLHNCKDIQEHFVEEGMESKDISQLFAWESRTRCSFLGVFLNIYHKYNFFKTVGQQCVYCYFCGQKLNSCSQILVHLKTAHERAIPSFGFEMLPRCFVCWARIHSAEGLQAHYVHVHKIDGSDGSDQLQTYMRCNYFGDLWQQTIGDMEGYIIYCRLCDFKCAQSAKSLYVQHVRQAHSETSPDCANCKNFFKNTLQIT